MLAVVEASDSLKHELDRFGVTPRIGEYHYFDTVADALEAFHRS